MPMLFDPYYFILVLPALIFAMVAQSKVKSAFNNYSRINSLKGYTGADVAKQLLNNQGIHDVTVEAVRGSLTDHYDPRTKTLRLSESVYNSTSIAAIGVAAHETGHAVQHDKGYAFLNFRNFIFPITNVASRMSVPLIYLGIIFMLFGTGDFGYLFVEIGIVLFGLAVLFHVITLPVEFNASSRAVDMLSDYGFVTNEEETGVKKVLSAAALTYVASAAVSLASLLRLIMIFGRRRD